MLPSRAYETLGKTILESYAWGRAVVASDLGSRREVVVEGKTGLLFPPGDVVKLAKAISFLVERPHEAAEMGATGYALLSSRHSPQSHYSELTNCMRRLAPRMENPKPAGTRLLWRSRVRLRIAFIGGRGVISKYSGVETYYEEVGKRLAEMGHQVTVYCRTYFSPLHSPRTTGCA